jgi:cytochrome c553
MMYRVAATLLAMVFALPAHAAGSADAGRSKSQVCAGCHGADGNAAIPNYPKLAGQHAGYIVKQLQNFKSGNRQNAIMQGQVANLSQKDMEDIAAYYASQSIKVGAATDEAKRVMGERIYRGGIDSKGVAACMGCHGPTGKGNPPVNYPLLGGQNADYITVSMKDYRSGARGSDDAGKIMRSVAKRMSDDEINAVAHYISGLH